MKHGVQTLRDMIEGSADGFNAAVLMGLGMPTYEPRTPPAASLSLRQT